MQLLSEQQVIAGIRRGDEVCFQRLFDTYYEVLCQYSFTILRDMDESEDIVQSVFLKIWEKREVLTITHTLKSYLYRAVHNACINQLDHRGIRDKHAAYALRVGSDVQPPEVFPEEIEASIVAAINSLPDQCRRIFTMSRYEELKYSEIAHRLEISVNTVENQMSKALKILRTRLSDSIV